MMELEYIKVDPDYKKPRTFVCPHNEGVECSRKECYSCGWHPKRVKIRVEKIFGTSQEGKA